MNVNATDWTIIARSSEPGHWHWTAGWSSTMAMRASDDNTLIVMHRRNAHGWELVARMAGPAWRAFQNRRGLRK